MDGICPSRSETDSRKTRSGSDRIGPSLTETDSNSSNRIGSDQNGLNKILGRDETVSDQNRLKKYLPKSDPTEWDRIEPKRTSENTEIGRVGLVCRLNLEPNRTEMDSRKYQNRIGPDLISERYDKE